MFEMVTLTGKLTDSIAAAIAAWRHKHQELPTILLVAPAQADEAVRCTPAGMTVQQEVWMRGKVAVGLPARTPVKIEESV